MLSNRDMERINMAESYIKDLKQELELAESNFRTIKMFVDVIFPFIDEDDPIPYDEVVKKQVLKMSRDEMKLLDEVIGPDFMVLAGLMEKIVKAMEDN